MHVLALPGVTFGDEKFNLFGAVWGTLPNELQEASGGFLPGRPEFRPLGWVKAMP